MNCISSNITFYGNCMKAIEFYKKVFVNSKVEIIKYSEVADKLGFGDTVKEKGELIYQAKFNINMNGYPFFILMGDSPSILFLDNNTAGNNIDNLTFIIEVESKDCLQELYDRLIEDGKSNVVPKLNTLGCYEGSLMDQFGVCWILKTNIQDCDKG